MKGDGEEHNDQRHPYLWSPFGIPPQGKLARMACPGHRPTWEGARMAGFGRGPSSGGPRWRGFENMGGTLVLPIR